MRMQHDQICGLGGQGWRCCGRGKRNKLRREKLEAIALDRSQDVASPTQDTDGSEGKERTCKEYLGH